ncbi:hypothetical protein ACIGZJ_34635 [Kitasatospora sp. NPDC052868]|uniref:hypothetical protein n=1 Tax=Kitasatospora sp. NPDC052868 TaxID=3364060 RepID=UPI0037CB4139
MSVDQPTLVDLPLRPPGTCEECGRVRHAAGTGRPARYCGSTCRSAAHRRRRAQAAEATPQATAPDEAQAARRARLLELAAAVTATTTALADTLDQDSGTERPAAALRALLAAAADLTAQAARDTDPAADATKPHPADGGQPPLTEPAAPDFRRGNETPPGPPEPSTPDFRDRDETPPAAAQPAPTPTRTSTTDTTGPRDGAPEPDALLRRTADPVRSFGDPDRTEDLALTFGPDWTLSSWTARQAAGVRQLHHRGVRVGWTTLLPDGPWGLGGWIAVRVLDGGGARALTGSLGRPRTHRDPGGALEALQAAHTSRPAAPVPTARDVATPTAARPVPAPQASGWIGPRAVDPGLVTVPRHPMLRGLPDSDARRHLDPAVFGDWWALHGWTVQPDVWLVTGEGHTVGWVERGLPGYKRRWVAVYEECFLVDSATEDPVLHDTPEQAAHTVMKAYLAQV